MNDDPNSDREVEHYINFILEGLQPPNHAKRWIRERARSLLIGSFSSVSAVLVIATVSGGILLELFATPGEKSTSESIVRSPTNQTATNAANGIANATAQEPSAVDSTPRVGLRFANVAEVGQKALAPLARANTDRAELVPPPSPVPAASVPRAAAALPVDQMPPNMPIIAFPVAAPPAPAASALALPSRAGRADIAFKNLGTDSSLLSAAPPSVNAGASVGAFAAPEFLPRASVSAAPTLPTAVGLTGATAGRLLAEPVILIPAPPPPIVAAASTDRGLPNMPEARADGAEAKLVTRNGVVPLASSPANVRTPTVHGALANSAMPPSAVPAGEPNRLTAAFPPSPLAPTDLGDAALAKRSAEPSLLSAAPLPVIAPVRAIVQALSGTFEPRDKVAAPQLLAATSLAVPAAPSRVNSFLPRVPALAKSDFAVAGTANDGARSAKLGVPTAPLPANATTAQVDEMLSKTRQTPLNIAPAELPPANGLLPFASRPARARGAPGNDAARSQAHGLLLAVRRGDTLIALYRKIYRGVTPPPFEAVQAANQGRSKGDKILLFPAPLGGWTREAAFEK